MAENKRLFKRQVIEEYWLRHKDDPLKERRWVEAVVLELIEEA